ncbi:MAG: reverse transcriptase domain-containing protein [Endomicrobia bacterium]|nr:reverse transcriptase domain-containing protein [Endomicrobiia bacterium]
MKFVFRSKQYRQLESIVLKKLLSEPIRISSGGFLDSYNWSAPKIYLKDGKKFAVYGEAEKLVLRSFYDLLYPIVDKKLLDSCIGGRRNFGLGRFLSFVSQARELKLYCVLKTDIRDFFSSINHSILNDVLKKKFRVATDVRNLLFKILSLGCAEVEPKGIYCGNPLGKLLGNVYLSILDDFLSREGVFFVRYIDDICIFCRSRGTEVSLLDKLSKFCREKLMLELSYEKTGIYHMYFSKIKFLGFEFVGNYIGPSEENVQKFIRNIECLPKEYKNKGVVKFLKIINRYVYYFGHLYKQCNVRKLYKRLDELVRKSFREYLLLSGNGDKIETVYSRPLEFPCNLSFPNRVLKSIGLVSLYEIKLSWERKVNFKGEMEGKVEYDEVLGKQTSLTDEGRISDDLDYFYMCLNKSVVGGISGSNEHISKCVGRCFIGKLVEMLKLHCDRIRRLENEVSSIKAVKFNRRKLPKVNLFSAVELE